MPNIIIKEQDEVTFASFDVSENTVLIPMLYARSITKGDDGMSYYTEQESLPCTLFRNVTTFKNAMRDHLVYVNGQESLDRSYIMAYELLLQGLNVVIKPITYENIELTNVISEDRAYKIMEDALNDGALDEASNRNIFNIKFITTGGYVNCGKTYVDEDEENSESSEEVVKPVTTYKVIREIAKQRGDAIALIEFDSYFDTKEQLFETINTKYTVSDDDDVTAAFFPWSTFNVNTGADPVLMPASFGYLMAYAYSVKSNANWFAAAGTIRGFIPGLIKPQFEVGESMMHALQGDNDEESSTPLNINVNPIYNAGTYGYRIWGNRVVYKTSTLSERYMSFLNVRMLLCDIKKQIYHAAMRVTFEPNDDIVWINFKTLANSLLDQMKSGRGIKWYKWTKEVAPEKAMIKATLTIQPIEAVESFDINIVLTDEEATIAETI